MARVGIGGCEDAAAETVTLEHTEWEGEVAALGRASYERHEAGGAVRWDGDGELGQHCGKLSSVVQVQGGIALF